MNLISLTTEDLIGLVDISELSEDVTVLDLLVNFSDSDFILAYIQAFAFFVDNTISFSNAMDSLFIKEEEYSFKEIEEISKIILLQNKFVSKNDDNFKPLNDRAKKLREKILARKKKLSELKQDESNNIEFLDLISILCSNANGISLFNVFELNLFQFNDQFNRMKMIDDYEVSIQALLHGADSKNIKIKHWISKGE